MEEVIDLETRIRAFEEVLNVCAPLYRTGDDLSRALCQLWVTMSASVLLSCVESTYPQEVEAARSLSRFQSLLGARALLLNSENIARALANLLDALKSGDRAGSTKAIGETGILELCPETARLHDELETITASTLGQGRIIPLVELALFAVEAREFERATRYISEALTLYPESPELHVLLTLKGLIALNSGNIAEAKSYLIESVRVCEEDELQSVRSFSVLLANGLVACGEMDVVIVYLTRCASVWKHQQRQIAAWIAMLRHGKQPDFGASTFLGAMNTPKLRIPLLVARCLLLDSKPKSPRMTRAQRQEILAEYTRRNLAAIKGKLDIGKN